MEQRFFRSEPDAPITWPNADTAISLVVFERHNDPDAINHAGHDFYGASGDSYLIEQWAEDQPLEPIDRNQLPERLTWFPAPFSDPEA